MKINGEMRFLWRAVDHEGEVLESHVTKKAGQIGGLAVSEEGAEVARHGTARQGRGHSHRRPSVLYQPAVILTYEDGFWWLSICVAPS